MILRGNEGEREKKKYLVWTLMDCGFTILLVKIHRFSFVIVKKTKI